MEEISCPPPRTQVFSRDCTKETLTGWALISGSKALLSFWCPPMVTRPYCCLRLQILLESRAPEVSPGCTRSSSAGWTRALGPDTARDTAEFLSLGSRAGYPARSWPPSLTSSSRALWQLQQWVLQSTQLPHSCCWLWKTTWFTSTNAAQNNLCWPFKVIWSNNP